MRVKVRRIPLLIRVATKLHNYIIDKQVVGPTKVKVARGDVRPGDIASPLFTDGTGGNYIGRRSDLEETNTRAFLCNKLRKEGMIRPAHSSYCKVGRI